jgi:phage gp46-like protein
MTDLALFWDREAYRADLRVMGGDLAVDDGLHTAVIISLLTDRLADPDDFIPDGTTDRRGWWADLPLPSADDLPTPDFIGSRLWLLAREKQIPETARRAEHYAREALQWMLDDDVAARIDAVATFPRLGWMQLAITIWQGSGSMTFDVMWAQS